MTRNINEVQVQLPANRDALIEEAAAIEETCVSVGGLARDPGMIDASPESTLGPVAFARLVEFWRREQRLSVAELAKRTGLQEAEVIDAERGDTVPEPRVLHALSGVLSVSYEKLLHLTGHVAVRDEPLSRAVVRFAARSEPMDQLSQDEEEALHDFIRALTA
jgi:HTH-type transcriptional regulator, competence development regulator